MKLKASTVYKKSLEALRRFPKKFDGAGKKENRALMLKVRARIEGEAPIGFDAEREAGCMLLNAQFHDWGQRGRAIARGFRLCQQDFGLRAAAEALTLTLTIRLVQENSRTGNGYHFALNTAGEWHAIAPYEAWEELREAIAFADDVEYEETKAWLLVWYSAADKRSLPRVRAPFVLPGEIEPSLDEFARTTTNTAPLLACVSTAQQAESLLENGRNVERFLPTLVHQLGLAALPLLLDYKTRIHESDNIREVVRALSIFVGEAPARAIIDSVDAKSSRALIGEYFTSHPELGLLVLPEFIKNQRKKAPREAAKAILSSCESALKAGHDKTKVAAEASDSDLPAVLVTPPWHQKRKKAKKLILELSQAELAPKLDLSDDERDALAKKARRAETTYWTEAKGREHLDQAQTGTPWGNLGYLQMVKDDDVAFRYIQTIPNWWTALEPLRAMIARLGERIAPYVQKFANEDIQGVVGACDLGAVEIAPIMAAAQLRTKTKTAARRWLSRFPEHASVGLIPDLFGSDNKRRKAATAALRYVVSREAGESLRKAGSRYEAEVEAAVLEFVDADPLLAIPPKKPKLPAWLNVASFPRLEIKAGGILGDTEATYVVEMLMFSPSDPCYVGLEHVQQACTQSSLDAFVQALCTAWVTAGAKSAWSWAVYAVGHLGGDNSARWLVRQIDVWASDGGKAKAIIGLEALAMIGSDVALMPLGRWSRRGRTWLKESATEILAAVAEERGLSRDELDDRTAPTLGLDESGKLMLDYGERSFFVRFDERLVPSIWDEDGERVAKIPPVRKTDDREKGTAAKKQWAALKKDAERLAQGQIDRLERAMTMKRRWSVAEFSEYIVGHPLVGHLARRLVFGVFKDNHIKATFRPEQEGTLADHRDEPFVLENTATIGVVHPIDLDEAKLATWREVFADYELLQPFPQLGRKVSRILDDEKDVHTLERAEGIKAYTGRLFALRNRGWSLDGDPYSVHSATKDLGGGRIVWISWSPGFERERPQMQEHELGSLRLPGHTFGDLDPIEFSELVMDLESLRG